MQRAKSFFQSFDMFAASASLRVKGSSSVTRTSAGFLSFVLFCYFGYIFVNGMYNIFIFSSIVSSQTFQKIPLKQLHAENFMFGVGNLNLEPQFMNTQFDIFIQIKSTKQGVIQNITMVPCVPDQWKQLGEDYQNQFHLHYLERFLCPSQPEKLKIINSSLVEESTYFQIVIQPSNSSNLIQLHTKISVMEQLETNKFNLFYLDQVVIPNQQQGAQFFININNFGFYSASKKHKTLIRLSNFKVSTDFSIIPLYSDIQIEKGHSIEDFVLTDSDALLGQENCKIRFQLTNDQYIFTRKVGKIDEMFSYAGGLFALSIWCLGFFISSFNVYRYELMVAEGVFNYDKDGDKYRENQFGFLKYLKYTTYLWIKQYFFYQPKWLECIKIQQTISQVSKQMDVINLFRKLQFLEMSLIFATNQSQNSIIALTEFRSLSQVKEDRLILEYYDAIINGEPAATVEDALNGSAMSFPNLKKNSEKYRKKNGFYEEIQQGSSNTNRSLLLQQDSQIKLKVMEYLKLQQFPSICQAIARYPKAQEQARSVVLAPQLQNVEKHLTQHFLNLDILTRVKIMKKIPLKIIHRLRIKSQKLMNGQMESSLEYKEEGLFGKSKPTEDRLPQVEKLEEKNQQK